MHLRASSCCAVALAACSEPEWRLRIENHTGSELPCVEGRLSWPGDLQGFGGSAEDLRAGEWTRIAGHGHGPPQVWVAVLWAKGERAQELAVGTLQPEGTDLVVRLARDRRIEFVEPH